MRIPSLDEVIAVMMQEESRMKVQSEANGVGLRFTLIVSNSDMTRALEETRKCYNCGEVGHLRQACPKPLEEGDFDGHGHGQSGGCGRGCGGQRGGRGGYQANSMVAEEEEEAGVVFTEEDHTLLEVLRRKQRVASNGDKKSVIEDASTSFLSRGNVATYAHSTKCIRQLGKEFEVKGPGLLQCFLRIEVAHRAKEIVLFQRKYVLDLLTETSILGCKLAVTPIDQKFKLSAEAGEPIDRERYQRLVGRLIHLNHIRLDISFAISVVSYYMHDPRKDHMDAVYQILRYLKSALGKRLIFGKNGHLGIEGYCDFDWTSYANVRRSTSGYCMFVGGDLIYWKSKKQLVVARSTIEAEYRIMA